MIRTTFLAVAISTALFLAPSNANAQWGFGGQPFGGYSWGWGTAFNSNYGWNYVPPPPYFAVHPPVYYSPHITARHYGASPYAWYPGMQPITYINRSAAAPTSQAQMIENPYVRSQAQANADAKPAETQPVHIANPYFAQLAR